MSSENKWIDPFQVKDNLESGGKKYSFYSLKKLAAAGHPQIEKLPYSIRVLLEALLRQIDNYVIEKQDVTDLIGWNAKNVTDKEIPFKPARVIMQDFTGVPGVVDLAAMRDALSSLNVDPSRINPVLPVDLVIDHSVQLDEAGDSKALEANIAMEFERNSERYEFLRWGSGAFDNFKVVPPATGIVHQVNLEFLAKVVATREMGGETFAFCDSVVGTDSHTTMINGLGVVGWGVGGIEAEAVMLDQPVYMLVPEVVGFRLSGALKEGVTATDLVLTVTQILRKHGVVGKFVEFFGPGLKELTLADRATIANMAPEYGATMGFFPVDQETVHYLEVTGRNGDLVEKYCKAQGLFADEKSPAPEYSALVELDMSTVEPSVAGPRRPQDRVRLADAKQDFHKSLAEFFKVDVNGFPASSGKSAERKPSYEKFMEDVKLKKGASRISHGSIVIASITSCTNTSNPSVLLAAGLLAKKAVEKGLNVQPFVKTSLAPGSRVVNQYLQDTGLLPFLEKLGFHIVGYGCATCIGNSGPIDGELSRTINEKNLVAAAVLSGNRNFEGRIHQDVRANYLASPPLVVAYALAGTIDFDMEKEPLGTGKDGKPVYLADIWPTHAELKDVLGKAINAKLFATGYKDVFSGNDAWKKIKVSEGKIYQWKNDSTYIRKPSFFEGISMELPGIKPLKEMRVLASLGDSVTTDHISPAGNIKADSPAGKWLQEHGVKPVDFNTYGARRGNHEVMMRGTFANIRIRNKMVPGTEGGLTRYIPGDEKMTIYDAAVKYMAAKTPLLILAGKEYGTGSSRDWAAKGTAMLGVKAVIAESYERIHRSNLIGMGIIPLEFTGGANAETLKLDGSESFSIPSLGEDLKPKQMLEIEARRADGSVQKFQARVRIDTPVEVEYYRNGGILQTVLRKLGKG